MYEVIIGVTVGCTLSRLTELAGLVNKFDLQSHGCLQTLVRIR